MTKIKTRRKVESVFSSRLKLQRGDRQQQDIAKAAGEKQPFISNLETNHFNVPAARDRLMPVLKAYGFTEDEVAILLDLREDELSRHAQERYRAPTHQDLAGLHIDPAIYFRDLQRRVKNHKLEICISIAYSNPPMVPGTEVEVALGDLLNTGKAVFNMCIPFSSQESPVSSQESPNRIPEALWMHQKKTEREVATFHGLLGSRPLPDYRNRVNLFRPVAPGSYMALAMPLTPLLVVIFNRDEEVQAIVERELIAWNMLPGLERRFLRLESYDRERPHDAGPAKEYLNIYDDYFRPIQTWWEKAVRSLGTDDGKLLDRDWIKGFNDRPDGWWRLEGPQEANEHGKQNG